MQQGPPRHAAVPRFGCSPPEQPAAPGTPRGPHPSGPRLPPWVFIAPLSCSCLGARGCSGLLEPRPGAGPQRTRSTAGGCVCCVPAVGTARPRSAAPSTRSAVKPSSLPRLCQQPLLRGRRLFLSSSLRGCSWALSVLRLPSDRSWLLWSPELAVAVIWPEMSGWRPGSASHPLCFC